MRTPVTLVTGASGEIGHGLITRLAGTGRPIVTIDLAPLDPALSRLVRRALTPRLNSAITVASANAEIEKAASTYHEVIPIAKAGDQTPFKGSTTLTPEQMADLLAGRWYVNVHTPSNPPGELRGQVVKK